MQIEIDLAHLAQHNEPLSELLMTKPAEYLDLVHFFPVTSNLLSLSLKAQREQ
jgi:hypothetical protein